MKAVTVSVGSLLTLVVAYSALSVTGCSTGEPKLGSQAAALTPTPSVGTCAPGQPGAMCTSTGTGDNQIFTCTCDTGQPTNPCSPDGGTGGACDGGGSGDGGPPNYTFCGFKSITGVFNAPWAAGGSIAQIHDPTGTHWEIFTQGAEPHGAPAVTWICAHEQDFTPPLQLWFAGDNLTATSSLPPYNASKTVGGYDMICPWTDIQGQIVTPFNQPGQCTGNQNSPAEFGAQMNGVAPTTTIDVSLAASNAACGTVGPLQSGASCSIASTGMASPPWVGWGPSTSPYGWNVTLSGASTSVSLGVASGAGVCYLTQWNNFGSGNSEPVDQVWVDNSGPTWTLNKNNSYITVSATCFLYTQP